MRTPLLRGRRRSSNTRALAASLFVLTVAFTMAGACGGNAVLDSGIARPGEPDGAAVRDAASDRSSVPPSGSCGDGVLDEGEACDGLAFPSLNCTQLSMGAHTQGEIHCTPDCSIQFFERCGGADGGSAVCDEGCGTVGTCNPSFCPSYAAAPGCCVTPSGPCGMNYGSGCVPPGPSCDPSFCPSAGTGIRCCVTDYGPCGNDYGMGCVPPSADGGQP